LEGRTGDLHTLAGQSNATPRYERRIIERTRLLELLDGVQARTVLLVAPAGYGKTTLARQWIERVGGGWVTSTRASADLPVLARDLASALATVTKLDPFRMETALSAGGTPLDRARAVARAILAQVSDSASGWIVVDDYHHLASNSAAEELVSLLERSGKFRFLITSRDRPSWATSRRRVYMEILELTAADLALDEAETSQLLPPDRRTLALRKQARGWPAVIALAAHADLAEAPSERNALSATLYDYFAEELFGRASPEVQSYLTGVAVLPPLNRVDLASVVGSARAGELVVSTGLAYEAAGSVEVHPLARAFLLAKGENDVGRTVVATKGFNIALSQGRYDEAFETLCAAELHDELEPLICASYAPLVEGGRIATLDRYGRYASQHGRVSAGLLDLLAADFALAEGDFEHALELAELAADRLAPAHRLRARCYVVAGMAAHFAIRDAVALELFSLASHHATNIADANDAAWGKCLASLALEDDRFESAVSEFESAPELRPRDRIRLDNMRAFRAIVTGRGRLRRVDPDVAELVSLTPDPWARSGWGFIHGSSLVLQARYEEAEELLRSTLNELRDLRLSFGMPHVEWALAAALLGLRKFSRSESLLRTIERRLVEKVDVHTELNLRALRARLHLAQQRPQEALELTADDFGAPPGKAMYGEYLATRALTLAVLGDDVAAVSVATEAEQLTGGIDTRVLCAAARATVAVNSGESPEVSAQNLLSTCSGLGCWDGLVCAVRASPSLLAVLMTIPRYRSELRATLLRSNDLTLAKSVGLVTRVTGSSRTLSLREREIMEHVRQGRKNREIAQSLFIAVGTVKRHLVHIYDKLGAHSRAEAIARYAEIEMAETEDAAAP
jgi:ATP/maltotriose-dependent transcriptional regulator MalT